MEKKKLKREDFSYTYDSRGYMLYYKGRPLGGAGTLPSDKPMHWRHRRANLKMYRENAEAEIKRLVEGNGQGRFKELIEQGYVD